MTPDAENVARTILDLVAVLLVAFALGMGLAGPWGWWSWAVAGVWLFLAARVAELAAERRTSKAEAGGSA